MSEYKRFTKKDKYGHWYTDTKINDRFMWSTDGKVWERDLTHCSFDGEAIDRLAELEDKLENGLLKELPCGVGTTVYCIAGCFKGFFRRKFVYDIVEYPFEIGMVDTYQIDWFLTEGEAEARLKELQEK